jgi:hypothetical protein
MSLAAAIGTEVTMKAETVEASERIVANLEARGSLMSSSGTKRTSGRAQSMSAFGGKADTRGHG